MPQHTAPLKVRIEDRLILTAIRFMQLMFRPWPVPVAATMAGWIGFCFGRVSKRRRVALKNLKAAWGEEKTPAELQRIIDDCYRNVAMSMAEFVLMPYMSDAYIESHVQVDDLAHLDRLVKRGKGVILLTGHFGNWEFHNMIARVKNYSFSALARTQKHALSDAFMTKIRESRGSQIIQRGISTRQIIKALKAGGIVGIVTDQDGGADGVWVPFFNRPSSCPRGVARFAKITEAAVVPTFVVRESAARHRVYFGTEIPVSEEASKEGLEEAVMKDFCSQLEREIRRYPSQWLWPHRRWKSSPDRMCLLLDDGKNGHTHQSMAFYQALVQKRQTRGVLPGQTHLKVAKIEYQSPWRRRVLTLMGLLTRGRFPGGRQLLKFALTPRCWKALETHYADFVISCGSGTEAVNPPTGR